MLSTWQKLVLQLIGQMPTEKQNMNLQHKWNGMMKLCLCTEQGRQWTFPKYCACSQGCSILWSHTNTLITDPPSSTHTVLRVSTKKTNVNSHAPLITKCNASTACISSRKKIELKNTSTFLLSQLSPLLSKNQDNPTRHLTPQPHSQLKQQQNTMVMQQMCTLFFKIPWKTYPLT